MKRIYVYDPDTKEMVEIVRARGPRGPLVIDDIVPFRSPINGYPITTRPKLKSHLLLQGLDPTADTPGSWISKARRHWPAVKHACGNDLNRIGHHYRRAFEVHFRMGRTR